MQVHVHTHTQRLERSY
jgi:hypothetical protein